MKKVITPLILLFAATASAALPLKIYSGQADTVTTATQTIIAVTESGATATINGNAVKVYKTGSFGAEVSLAPGNNTITVTADKNGEHESRTFKIFRAEAKKATSQKTDNLDDEVTTPL